MAQRLESVQVETAPASIASSLAVIKAQLQVDQDYTQDDALITEMIEAAELEATNWSQLVFSETSFKGVLKEWPTDRLIELPFRPLLSVTSLQYYNEENSMQTLPVANYDAITETLPGLLQLDPELDLPSLYDRPDAIKVVYVCGSANIPADIKKAIRKKVANDYEYREDQKHEKASIADLLLGAYNSLA